MTLESGLLLLLVALVAVAFYCLQRSVLEILRTLRLINAKVLNVAAFLKPYEAKSEQSDRGEPLPKLN